MRYVLFIIRVIIVHLLLPVHSYGQSDSTIEYGVSEKQAIERKQILKEINYRISFIIPQKKPDPISAKETISFYWKKNVNPLQIDFKENPDHLQKIMINNKIIDIVFEKEHLLIDPLFLHNGNNVVTIDFIAGNLSLNRNDDYLYTLLVPDRARTVFPCFDQPDLKATFELTLTIPKDWEALSNAPLYNSWVSELNKTYHFERSDKISTYLFSFAAGKFETIKKIMGGRPMIFYHRETDTAKIRLSTDPIFQIQDDALTFLEKYTQVPFPFKKFDFIAIPDFQYGGMEHVGAIDYKASSLFLDAGATRDEEINRSSLLSHETAHMWFGDLVTMRWFNDVWEKEVFANFMADKITQLALPNTNFDLKFLLDHFPTAYSIDRTGAPNPIRQPLENLQDAGSLYGNIIYHKAPIMMRQLERLMGKDAFRDGLREYLKKYSYDNASWPDLIKILSKHTKNDLDAWNNVWVNETGRPLFEYTIKHDENKIGQLVISQRAEDGSKKIWPQIFEIAFVYPDNHIEQLTVKMTKRSELIKQAAGKKIPAYILFNSSGQGYGVFPINVTLIKHFGELKNPVIRASAYINVFENMLAKNIVKPIDLLDQYRTKLSVEKEELNLRLITGEMSEIFWHFITPETRMKIAGGLENDLWTAIQTNSTPNIKKVLFRTLQNIAISNNILDTLNRFGNTKEPQ